MPIIALEGIKWDIPITGTSSSMMGLGGVFNRDSLLFGGDWIDLSNAWDDRRLEYVDWLSFR